MNRGMKWFSIGCTESKMSGRSDSINRPIYLRTIGYADSRSFGRNESMSLKYQAIHCGRYVKMVLYKSASERLTFVDCFRRVRPLVGNPAGVAALSMVAAPS